MTHDYKRHGTIDLFAAMNVGTGQVHTHLRKGHAGKDVLAFFKHIDATVPRGLSIHVILDNLSAHKGIKIRAWAARNKVELCFTPTYGSWANPIEAHFGPLRTFVIAGSNHPNHPALTGHLHRYLRWRNANARHPDVLAAQRRERARIRSEKGHRWGRPQTSKIIEAAWPGQRSWPTH